MEIITKPGMSIDSRDASAASVEPPPSPEVLPAGESSARMGEGLGVFRALLLTVLFYAAAGFILWSVWLALRHWFAR